VLVPSNALHELGEDVVLEADAELGKLGGGGVGTGELDGGVL
jgi:hypothetical protein